MQLSQSTHLAKGLYFSVLGELVKDILSKATTATPLGTLCKSDFTKSEFPSIHINFFYLARKENDESVLRNVR